MSLEREDIIVGAEPIHSMTRSKRERPKSKERFTRILAPSRGFDQRARSGKKERRVAASPPFSRPLEDHRELILAAREVRIKEVLPNGSAGKKRAVRR